MQPRPLDPTSPHEIHAALALFEKVYGRTMSEAFYRWRFVENPFGPPMVSLLWDGDVLAGHYAVSPTRTWLDGEAVLAAQSMTTMTHPSHRNRGVFTILARHLYGEMTRLGARLVWGLPNTQSHYGFRHKLGWRDVGLLWTMTCELDAFTASGYAQPAPPPGPWMTTLFERNVDRRIFPSAKTEAYFRWRYVENPEQRYSFFGDENVILVTKDYATPRGPALEVVDYLFGSDTKSFGSALHALGCAARERGCVMMRTWMDLGDPAFVELEKLGFVPREPLAYFGGRSLAGAPIAEERWAPSHWAITMGSSDNY